MRRANALLGVAAVCTPVVTAAADSGRDQAKLRKITVSYGACVVRKHHAKASEAVLATASNRQIIGPMAQIVDSDCLITAAGTPVAEMRFPNDTYQYALADALVNADFRGSGATSFADRLPLAQPPFPDEDAQKATIANAKNEKQRQDLKERFSRHFAFAWLARYGECVVRHGPEDARYWLLTPPDTPEEASRIKALQSALSSCMSNGTMHFNRITLRGVVAVNYYRLAMATIIPPAGANS